MVSLLSSFFSLFLGLRWFPVLVLGRDVCRSLFRRLADAFSSLGFPSPFSAVIIRTTFLPCSESVARPPSFPLVVRGGESQWTFFFFLLPASLRFPPFSFPADVIRCRCAFFFSSSSRSVGDMRSHVPPRIAAGCFGSAFRFCSTVYKTPLLCVVSARFPRERTSASVALSFLPPCWAMSVFFWSSSR